MGDADQPVGIQIAELDGSVAARIIVELGQSGERVLRCLRTAQWFLECCTADSNGLRYSASAAYNLREALDSVVRDRPAGQGGLTAALVAWDLYKLACELPDVDEPTERAQLASVLDGLARDSQRQAYMTRRLLSWFQQQTGLGPIAGSGDPTVQYQRLRDSASAMLHGDADCVDVQGLFGETVAWFVRFFMPPSDIARQIEVLAALPFTPDRLVELRSVALNDHHLRQFLELVADPDWLDPMRQAGLIGLPAVGEMWPITALTAESHRVERSAVAELLWQLAAELSSIPQDERPACAFEIARSALWLGESGYPIVVELLRRFPADDGVQSIALSVASRLTPSDEGQVTIADAIIGNESRRDRGHRSRQLVARLVEGMTEQNVVQRLRLIAVKLRRLATAEPYMSLDIVALSVAGVDESEHVVVMAERLASAIAVAHSLGLASTSIIEHVAEIPGELGERLVCQVLASAEDIERSAKLAHLAKRFVSPTATGDDRALLDSLLPLDDDDISFLRDAFGAPPPTEATSDRNNSDWARAWRWSMLLPPSVLTGWEEAIASVSAIHGKPDPTAMDRRSPMSGAAFGSSPIDAADLAAVDVLEAAGMIASWRPSATDPWGVSARELARTLESLVADEAVAWTLDPVAVVRTLREPVYIDHYFRALKSSGNAVGDQATSVVRAIELARRERWEPVVLGRDSYEFEPDWSSVETASVELIAALAAANADLGGELDLCWELATASAQALPADLGSSDDYTDTGGVHDPLHHAINSVHGNGLRAVLELGGWEHRNLGAASPRLAASLSNALTVDGAVGLQLRAVMARSRAFLETIAVDWMEQNDEVLFGDELGRVTVHQTLKYGQPTKFFYDRSLERLLGAARRRADHAAAWLLIGHLREEPGYTFDRIVDGLSGADEALREISRELARLAAGVPDDQVEVVARAIRFWEQLLEEAGRRVPVAALVGLGGWALCEIIDPTAWFANTEQTLTLTGGAIDFASEVADRCRDQQPSAAGLRILCRLIGYGDRWEQHHVESTSVEALQAAAHAGLDDDAVGQLRERLIQRGRHDAASPGRQA